MIEGIKRTNPDVILNTINGDSNAAFFKGLRAAGITNKDIPVISFSIAENELHSLLAQVDLTDDYACWNYFQSVTSPENRRFVDAYKRRFGEEQVTSDPMESAYISVHLWAQAAKEAGTPDVAKVLKTIKNQSAIAPAGMVYISSVNNHSWKTVRIGKIRAMGSLTLFGVRRSQYARCHTRSTGPKPTGTHSFSNSKRAGEESGQEPHDETISVSRSVDCETHLCLNVCAGVPAELLRGWRVGCWC